MSYNGHANRETWNVSLWLNNDEGLYNELRALARRADNVNDLATKIEELCNAIWADGKTPDGDDLGQADFDEIAAGEWETYREEDDPETGEPKDGEPEDAPSGTLAAFITKHDLKFECHRVNARPDGLMSDSKDIQRHFKCHITGPNFKETDTATGIKTVRQSYSFSLYFSQGSAHTEEPTLADVLDCLASDASSYDNAGTFEEWASEYGYDSDSRKAEKTYKAIKRQAEQLKRTLGQDAYEELLYKTERQ